MQSFMPWHGLLGGVLIGLAAAFHLLVSGRIAGVSGILEEALSPTARGFAVSAAFVIGLMLGGLAVAVMAPGLVPAISLGSSGAGLIVVAGLLVGLGARIGGGCTSGHGVCGLPRLSPRSGLATLTFMAVAAATVFVARHVI